MSDRELAERFVAELRQRVPETAAYYLAVDADDEDGTPSVTIDGWWTIADLAAALREITKPAES